MSYALGIDLGTTFTAAAICESGRRPSMISLGSSGYSVPSVLFLRDDNTFLIGEAAEMRALVDPTRVARYFKRQLGDPGSRFIGGTPYSPQTLTSHLLASVLSTVVARQGSEPDTVVLTHPANWGPYRREVFEQAAAMAGVRSRLLLLSEPEAAAIHYATSERIEPGELIGVYDLGGGTFDAVVMRRTATGFELVGQPQGVERLGGVDFDDVIWEFVADVAELDVQEMARTTDETLIAGGHALRNSCVSAKRLLSADTTADIRIALPTVNQTVRLNRKEFENRIRPRLVETITALEGAMRSGGVGAEDLSRVLLVGGSSRIPIVSQLLVQHFGRPIALDSDPKNTVALGAALQGTLSDSADAGSASSVSNPTIDLSQQAPSNPPPAPLAPSIDLTEPSQTPPAPERLSAPAPPPAHISPPTQQQPEIAQSEIAQPESPPSTVAEHAPPATNAAAPTVPPVPPQSTPAPPVQQTPPVQAQPSPPTAPTSPSASAPARTPHPETSAVPSPVQPPVNTEPPSELDTVMAESRHRAAMPVSPARHNPFSAANEEPPAELEPVSDRNGILLAFLGLLVVVIAVAVVLQLR